MSSQHLLPLSRPVSAAQSLPRLPICQKKVYFCCCPSTQYPKQSKHSQCGSHNVLFLFSFLKKQQLCFVLFCFNIRKEFYSHQCVTSDMCIYCCTSLCEAIHLSLWNKYSPPERKNSGIYIKECYFIVIFVGKHLKLCTYSVLKVIPTVMFVKSVPAKVK